MAVTHVRSHAGGQTKSTGTTLAVALSAGVAANNTLYLHAVIDTLAGGTTPNITGITVPAGETATWTLVGAHPGATTSGANSVIGELWTITTTQAWDVAFTPTITWNGSRNARGAVVEEFSGVTTTVRGTVSAVTSATGAPSAAVSSPLAGDLVVAGSSWETGTAPSGDTDTTNGSWSGVVSIATTGGLDTSNLVAALQYKIVTADGAQTYDPTGTNNDAGAVVAVMTPAAGAHVGQATGSYSFTGSTVGAGGDAGHLDQFRTALNSRDSRRLNIGVYGASVVEGYPAPPTLWTEYQLAEKLRARYTTSGLAAAGGAGYSGIPTLGIENTAASPFSYSTGTFNENLGYGGHHRFWQVAAAQTTVCTYTVYADATRLVIHTIGGTAGDPAGGKYRINGGTWVTFNTYATQDQTVLVPIDGTFHAGDVLEMTKNLGTTGPVRIHGVSAFNGDESKGIVVHNHGHYGYRIQDWNVARSGVDPGYLAQLANYDLIIMSDWGGNDGGGPGNLSAADFQTAFAEHIDWMRSAGYAGDILISALYNIEAGRTFVDPWSEYVDAMRAVAAAKGCAFIQLDAYMPASPNAIYDADNVHGNADGSAYDLMSALWLEKIAPIGFSAPSSGLGSVTVGGVKKAVASLSVIIGGAKKSVVSESVIEGGVKKIVA
jgi:hypothetical protein